MHNPTGRIAHTTAFVTPVVEHWQERDILMKSKNFFIVYIQGAHFIVARSSMASQIVITCCLPGDRNFLHIVLCIKMQMSNVCKGL